MKEADKNKDGVLQYDEFVPFWLQRMKKEALTKSINKLRASFKVLDAQQLRLCKTCSVPPFAQTPISGRKLETAYNWCFLRP